MKLEMTLLMVPRCSWFCVCFAAAAAAAAAAAVVVHECVGCYENDSQCM